jgi:hypothetical protein
MTALLLSVVLAQATPAGWGEPLTWSDGARSHRLWVNPELVAEPAPSGAGAEALRAVAPEAELAVDKPTMRLWRVKDAAAVRAKLPALQPVLHEKPSPRLRPRVVRGLACGPKVVEVGWREALERSGVDGCTPNFWTPGQLR